MALDPEAIEMVRIVGEGENPKAIKEALKARFGSLEPAALIAQTHEIFEGTDLEKNEVGLSGVWEALLGGLLKILQKPDWAKYSRRDPAAYLKELDEVLGAIKQVMNAQNGVAAHRRRANQERDDLIFELKSKHPHWSFGQVAKEYRKRTGRPIDPKDKESDKWAQLSYSHRCDQIVQDVITQVRPDFIFAKLPLSWSLEGPNGESLKVKICFKRKDRVPSGD